MGTKRTMWFKIAIQNSDGKSDVEDIIDTIDEILFQLY